MRQGDALRLEVNEVPAEEPAEQPAEEPTEPSPEEPMEEELQEEPMEHKVDECVRGTTPLPPPRASSPGVSRLLDSLHQIHQLAGKIMEDPIVLHTEGQTQRHSSSVSSGLVEDAVDDMEESPAEEAQPSLPCRNVFWSSFPSRSVFIPCSAEDLSEEPADQPADDTVVNSQPSDVWHSEMD